MIHLIIIISLTLFYLFSSCLSSKKKEIAIPSFTLEGCDTKKAENIKEYLDTQLKDKLGFEIDIEKAIAIAKTNQNLLLRAGPGSGKTSTLAYKIFYLIKKENIKPEQIMALVFNREAAKKLRIKIRKDFGIKEFQNTRTFHSLAYQLVKPKNKILYGDETLEVVKGVVREMMVSESNMTDSEIMEITELFIQFIQRAKKSEMTSNDIQKEIKINYSNHRTESFLVLANKVYKKYEKYLATTNRKDFDDLLKKAIETVDKTKGGCAINVTKDKKVKMNELKYCLIDEGQDLSKLFWHLIQAIRKYNPDVRIFCVGDAMQSINGWAGADLEHFNNFSQYVDNSGVANLFTNYRSRKNIVDASNRFMANKDKTSIHRIGNEGGKIIIKYIKKENRISLVAGYLQLCCEIIKDNPNKTIAIIHRKNEIERMSLANFLEQLKGSLSKEEIKQVEISTIHGYKGKEADVVIILQAIKKLFPLIHPYNIFFRIFGETIDTILAGEERIFFVAITRAREKVYLLTEDGNESEYIKLLIK